MFSTMPEKMNRIRLREPSHRSTEKSRLRSPTPLPQQQCTTVCSVYTVRQCIRQNRAKSENQRISRTRASWTNWWLFWNVQLRLWVDCKWFRIDPECSRGLKLAKTCFSNKIFKFSKWNPFIPGSDQDLRPNSQTRLSKNLKKYSKNLEKMFF